MNFDDEDYVRLYTRDTPTWLSLGWEGQALLALTMRKVGRRNGVLDCDGFDPIEALATVTGLPAEVVAIGFERLSKRGVFAVDGQRIVLPKFVKAQWARQGVAARKRASRDAQAADTVITDIIIAQNHSTVTPCHKESLAVTTSHSPIPSNPTNPIPDPPVVPLPGDADSRRVFEAWQKAHRHPAARFDRKRKKRIAARISEGFTPEQLIAAIENARNDPFLMGKNDEHRVYDGLQTLLRDAEQVERLLALPANGATGASPVDLAKRQREKAAAEAELARRTRAELDELGTGERPIAESQQVLAAVLAGTHGRKAGSP